MGKAVTGALFFILGAFFSLLLVISVAMLLAGMVAPDLTNAAPAPRKAQAAAPRQAPRHSPQQPRLGYDRRAEHQAETARQRDSYRILTQLSRCEAALARIAALGEPPAAKIAEQTLRRIRNGAEPAQARLSFALARLELLSLRPETKARRAASDLLASLV